MDPGRGRVLMGAVAVGARGVDGPGSKMACGTPWWLEANRLQKAAVTVRDHKPRVDSGSSPRYGLSNRGTCSNVDRGDGGPRRTGVSTGRGAWRGDGPGS